MNIRDAVDQAGRLIEGIHRQTRDLFIGSSDTAEPAPGKLWDKATSALEKALVVYDRKDSPDTPESSWIPGRTIKDSCRKDLDSIFERSWLCSRPAEPPATDAFAISRLTIRQLRSTQRLGSRLGKTKVHCINCLLRRKGPIKNNAASDL